jgi:hypothetical protein
VKLAPRAWGVPARIVRTETGDWQAVMDGRTQAPHADPALAESVAFIWHSGTIIDEQEYEFLNAIRVHYATHGPPDHPALQPYDPIRPMLLPAIYVKPQRR